MVTMMPLMYGYLRLDIAGGQVAACEAQIRHFVEHEGFDLAMIFHERIHGGAALTALIAELQRSQSHHVVVPALQHLIQPGMARQAVEARLWREADAGVFVAAPTHNRAEVRAGCRNTDREYTACFRSSRCVRQGKWPKSSWPHPEVPATSGLPGQCP
jgi:hypothetical protein